jgi:hypothetical protein
MLSVIISYFYAERRYADCHYDECHYAECHYVECHYAECHYAECHGASICPLIHSGIAYNKVSKFTFTFPYKDGSRL